MLKNVSQAPRLAGVEPLGPIAPVAEISKFFQEVTSPTLILGMAAGAVGYRVGRLLGGGLARWGGAGATGLYGASRATGLAAEAAAFSAAATLLPWAEAGKSPPQFTEMFRSSLLMFSSLRLAQSLAVGGGTVAALAASYGGVLGNHLLQQKLLHWDSAQDSLKTMARQSLSETIAFFAGAFIAGRILAKPLSPLERALNLSIGKVELPRFPAGGLAWQTSGASLPPVEFRPDPPALRGERTHMISSGEGEGGPGKKTGNFLNPLQPDQKNPFELVQPLDFPRRAIRKEYQFAERLARGDMDYTWNGTESIEPYLELYLKVVNQVARHSGLNSPRTIRFLPAVPGPETYPALVKVSAGEPFIRAVGKFSPTISPRTRASREVARVALVSKPVPASSRFPQADAVIQDSVKSMRSLRDTLPFPPPFEIKAPAPAKNPARLGQTITSLDVLWWEIREFIDRQNNPTVPAERTPIKEREFFYFPQQALTFGDITRMESLLRYIPDGMTIKIHDLTGKTSWEICTEFGEPRFQQRDLPHPKKI